MPIPLAIPRDLWALQACLSDTALVSQSSGQLEWDLILTLGNFLGPLVFKESEAPLYPTGWITTVVTSCVAVVLAIVYRFICVWENKKRDKSGVEAFEHAYEDDLTDRKNPQFRYTL